MTLNPCINVSFDGQCEAAFRLYERCLDAKISFMLTWADSPMAKDAPPKWGSKIWHATLVIGDFRLQGSDPAPGRHESPKGFVISLDPVGQDAERVFAELAEGGIVRMPLQETFWAHRYGELTDRFGIHWAINSEKPG